MAAGHSAPSVAPTSPPYAPHQTSPAGRIIAVVAAAAALVLVAGGVLAWIYRPGYRSLDYRPLAEHRRIEPVVPIGFDWSDAEIIGNRAYFASSDSTSGAAGVVAIDLDASKPAWTSRDAIGTAPRWKSMTALPIGVALFTDVDTDTGKRRMVLLGAAHGDVLWQCTLAADDVMLFAGNSAVVADREGNRLVGLDVATGDERWSLLDPASTSTLDTNVFTVTTAKDLGGPATVSGRPYQPDLTDDPRIVQIAADRSARVIDADSGKVLTARQNVADPDDEVVAHNGRLIVLQPDDQRIASYELKKLGEPRVLYTAQAQNSQMKDVTPCGDDRVCFDEEIGYDGKTATVVALDVSDGSKAWSYPLANTETLVPVGEAVLATTTAAETTLIDADGKKIWTHTGEAARLDGGNLLEFSKPLSRSPGDPALSGRHIGDQAVPLGSFSDIRSDTCSWDTRMLACVAEKDFVLQTFTG